jgi:hypothetical protein
MAPSGLISRMRGRGTADGSLPKFAFVVTYGRSGSTLVQGLLNTLPRTLVRGENNFYVLPLFRSQALLRGFQREHAKHDQVNASSAFYGLGGITPADFVPPVRDLMMRHLLGSESPGDVDVLGFKEVLWHRVNPKETEPFFGFLDRVFPGALYVLNQRDHAQVAESGFWRSRDGQEVMQAITRVEQIQDHLRRTRPDRVYDTRYELLTSPDAAVVDRQLRGLAEFVRGSCDDDLLAELRRTMTKGHGPNPFGKSKKKPARDGSR